MTADRKVWSVRPTGPLQREGVLGVLSVTNRHKFSAHQADEYVRDQLRRCIRELASLDTKLDCGLISEAEYVSCRLSLEYAIAQIEEVLERQTSVE
jgi:anti-sigma-K factor RskA